MSRKSLIYVGASVGGIVGGYLPALWGAGTLSGWGVLLGGIGSIAGAIAAIKLT